MKRSKCDAKSKDVGGSSVGLNVQSIEITWPSEFELEGSNDDTVL